MSRRAVGCATLLSRSMLRLVPLVLCLALASCDSADPFDADRSSFSATVTGDRTADFEGFATYAVAQDSPLLTRIRLTDTNQPVIDFLFEGGSVRGTVYDLPEDARASFVTARFDGELFLASDGRVEITRTTETRAQGTFSFTAERQDETVTVRGEFVAVRDE